MARKPVNTTQVVLDYLKANPGALSEEIAAARRRQRLKGPPAHAAGINSQGTKTRRRTAKPAVKKRATTGAAVPLSSAVAEKPAKAGDAVTLDQVKKVARAIHAMGGIQRVSSVLAVIRELGGVKKFADLAEAMSATAAEANPY